MFIIISAYVYFFTKLEPEYRIEKSISDKVSFIIKNKVKEFNGRIIGVWGGNISFRMKVEFLYSASFDVDIVVEDLKRLGFYVKDYKYKYLLCKEHNGVIITENKIVMIEYKENMDDCP